MLLKIIIILLKNETNENDHIYTTVVTRLFFLWIFGI